MLDSWALRLRLQFWVESWSIFWVEKSSLQFWVEMRIIWSFQKLRIDNIKVQSEFFFYTVQSEFWLKPLVYFQLTEV